MSKDAMYVYVAHDLYVQLLSSVTAHLSMHFFLNPYKEMLQSQILHSILSDLILCDNILHRN